MPGWQGYSYPTGSNRKERVDRSTPSRLEALSLEDEDALRVNASSYIGKLGMSLFISQHTIGIAHIFFHRFFSRQSFRTHEWSLIALASLFLASKVEENPKRLDEVVTHHFDITKPGMKVDSESESFKAYRADVLNCERTLLHTLCFEICVTPAQKYIHDLVDCMKNAEKERIGNQPEKVYSMSSGYNELQNAALAFVNDSQSTNLCLQYPPYDIAYAGLLMGNKWMEQKKSTWLFKDPKFGMELRQLDCPSPDEVDEICTQMQPTIMNPERFAKVQQAMDEQQNQVAGDKKRRRLD